jgi:oxygen-independent coproporphyrinogen-3 oxidase
MDLMYGLPTQILAQWQSTLAAILELAPEHLSAYCLTLEPETPMARQTNAGTLPEPDPDLAATMYEWAAEELASHGYQGYEISNWAQPGSESRHNLTYWQNLPYLGVGPGAHSSLGGARFSLLLSPARYIHAVGRWAAAGAEHAPVLSSTVLRRLPTVSSAEAIPQPLEMAETLMLGLRLHVGVGLEEFQERFGMSMLKSHGEFIQQVTALGLAELTGRGREGRLRLTPRGRLLGNQVFSRLFEAPAQSRART